MFEYENGSINALDGSWSYNIKEAFDRNLEEQPQYKTMTEKVHPITGTLEGSYHIANMATGQADGDFRDFAEIQDQSPPIESELSKWLDAVPVVDDVPQQSPRNLIFQDAEVWFKETLGI